MTRILPHSLSAEAAILGALILRNSLLNEVKSLDDLENDSFYSQKHQVVFQAIRTLDHRCETIDVVTLANEVAKVDKLDAIGGIAFLGQLIADVPGDIVTPTAVAAHVAIVANKYAARRLALVASELVERVYRWGDDDANELVGEAMAKLAQLDSAKPDDASPIGDLVHRRVKELGEQWAARERGEVAITGAPTGISALDSKIGGYPFGVVSLLAARPAMGKTAMCMAAAFATAAAFMGVHVFSQEDGWRTCADRTIARFSQIGVSRLRKLELVDADVAGLRAATAKSHSIKNLLIDNRAGLSAAEIIRSVRRHKAKNQTRLVIVDYWQIVRRSRHLGDNENGALDEIITSFSHAAKQDDVAYLVLSQLNRKVEERADRRPGMSDIRGSGSGEERAKVVVSPYRGSYYYDLPKRGIDCDCSDAPDSRGKVRDGHDVGCFHDGKDHSHFEKHAQVLVLKDNNGQSGARVWASWNGPTTEIW